METIDKTKPIIVLVGSKHGGIRTYHRSLKQQFTIMGYHAFLYEDSVFITCLKIYWLRLRTAWSRRVVLISWGAYNALPFINCTTIAVFHGCPSIASQGIARYLLIIISQYLTLFLRNTPVTISKFSQAMLKHQYGINAKLIHNSLPYDLNINTVIQMSAKHKFSRQYDFLFVGRATVEKLPLKSVLAIARACIEKNLTFAIAAPRSSHLTDVVSTLKKCKLDSNLRLFASPNRQQILDIYTQSKIFVSLSEFEPFGLVYLEAFVSGCHLVGSPMGGYAELYAYFICHNPLSCSFWPPHEYNQAYAAALYEKVNAKMHSITSDELFKRFAHTNAIYSSAKQAHDFLALALAA